MNHSHRVSPSPSRRDRFVARKKPCVVSFVRRRRGVRRRIRRLRRALSLLSAEGRETHQQVVIRRDALIAKKRPADRFISELGRLVIGILDVIRDGEKRVRQSLEAAKRVLALERLLNPKP